MSEERSLTDDDVKAIVAELKTQLVHDFQMEVGKGVLSWVKRAAILLLILAAIYGFSKTGWLPKAGARGDGGKVPALIGKTVMRAVGVIPSGFTVIPPRDRPDDLMALAEKLDKLNEREAA